VLDGVNVTLSEGVPAAGLVPGTVQTKLPPTDAVPPLNVDDANVWP
jgi:hypothetical protein